MSIDIWWRGQSSAAAPSSPGGSIHDFGDGVYFTNRRQVAEEYASTRVKLGGGTREVFGVAIPRGDLGRVLDLTVDPKWQQFVAQKVGTQTVGELIKLANENYGRFFQAYLQMNKIDISRFDAVIGPEYVRGGNQLALLHRNGQPSALAQKVRANLQPVTLPPNPRPSMFTVSSRQLPTPVLATRGGVLANPAAVAWFGQLLAGAIQSLGSYLVQKRVEEELETTYADAVHVALERGEGVLVIVALEERIIPDVNGHRNPMLITVNIQAGQTQDSALEAWRGVSRLLQGPVATEYRIREEYIWIEPRL